MPISIFIIFLCQYPKLFQFSETSIRYINNSSTLGIRWLHGRWETSLPNLERVRISWTNDNKWSNNIKAALHRYFCTKIWVKIFLKTFIASPNCEKEPNNEKNILKVLVKEFHIRNQVCPAWMCVQHKVIFWQVYCTIVFTNSSQSNT